jgi:D-methionine transport system ATP-binding protein
VIALSGLEKAYPGPSGPVHALRGIDLTIARGEIFGIIGRSGAGKSTLIRCMNLLERPTGGRVVVDDIDLTALGEPALRARRRAIGMIFQHFNLLSSRTVYGNIALPLELAGRSRAAIAEAVEPLLDFVGLRDQRDRYPAQISGGQAQRVGIARALAVRPAVLLCDEATSALDPQTTQAILALLRDANRTFGVTIALITHEMAVIKAVCDRVAVLDAGRIVESGPVREVFAHPQSPVTKAFIGSASPEEIATMLGRPVLAEPPGGAYGVLWRLAFDESAANESVIANLIRTYPLDLNIVSGTVERVGGKPLGLLVVEAAADASVLAQARTYVAGAGVRVEVMGYVDRRPDAAA